MRLPVLGLAAPLDFPRRGKSSLRKSALLSRQESWREPCPQRTFQMLLDSSPVSRYNHLRAGNILRGWRGAIRAGRPRTRAGKVRPLFQRLRERGPQAERSFGSLGQSERTRENATRQDPRYNASEKTGLRLRSNNGKI